MGIFTETYEQAKNVDKVDCARGRYNKSLNPEKNISKKILLPSCAQSTMSTNAPVKAKSVDNLLRSASTMSTNLPTACPILTGIVPDACRYHPKIFNRLVAEGVLPFDGGTCPIKSTCNLARPWPKVKI